MKSKSYQLSIPEYDRVQKYSEYWAFVEWIATPTPRRNPQTQGAFARDHSMHETTLSKWRRMPEFKRDVMKTVADGMAEHTADVGYSLLSKIFKDGSAAEVRLFREWAHEWMPTLKIEQSGEVTHKTEISDEVVEKLVDEFNKKLREHYAKPRS